MKLSKVLIFIILTSLFISCAPPAGWRKTSYIYSQRYKNFANKQTSLSGDLVKVRIYKGKAVAITANAYQFKATSSKTGRGSFLPSESGTLKANGNIFKFNNKTYPGYLEIIKEGNAYQYINVVPFEEYLVSVVGHEMSRTWPLEALKAQAVVARTYAAQRQKQNVNNAYQLDASTNHQVYGGLIKQDENLRKAVSETKGQILIYGGGLANVFFYSSCGGKTAAASEVWKTDYPYLKSKVSPYCKGTPAYAWQKNIALKTFAAKFGIDTLYGVKVASRSQSGRVQSVILVTSKGRKTISGRDIRSKFGATFIKSTLFGMRVMNGQVQIAGKGYGHGVGLCQWGSRRLAERRKSYRSIISFYFPGVNISDMRKQLFASR